MKLDKAIEKLHRLEHIIGVYDVAIERLDRFLPNDLGESTEELVILKTQFTIKDRVPPEVIEEVIGELSAVRDKVQGQLNKLIDAQVKEGK